MVGPISASIDGSEFENGRIGNFLPLEKQLLLNEGHPGRRKATSNQRAHARLNHVATNREDSCDA